MAPARALTMSHIFGDHMVLQSGQPVPVWDEAACSIFFNKAGLPAVPFRTDNPLTQATGK